MSSAERMKSFDKLRVTLNLLILVLHKAAKSRQSIFSSEVRFTTREHENERSQLLSSLFYRADHLLLKQDKKMESSEIVNAQKAPNLFFFPKLVFGDTIHAFDCTTNGTDLRSLSTLMSNVM